MATSVVRKSWKARMDRGSNPRGAECEHIESYRTWQYRNTNHIAHIDITKVYLTQEREKTSIITGHNWITSEKQNMQGWGMKDVQEPTPMAVPSCRPSPQIRQRMPRRRRSTERTMANCVQTCTLAVVTENGFCHLLVRRQANRFWYTAYSRWRTPSVEHTSGLKEARSSSAPTVIKTR